MRPVIDFIQSMLIAAAIFFILWLVNMNTAQAETIYPHELESMNYYETQTELLSLLPIGRQAVGFRVIYSIPLPDIKEGDLLTITSTSEVTLRNVPTVFLAGYIMLGISKSDTTQGILVTKRAGIDVLRGNEHQTMPMNKQFIVPALKPGVSYSLNYILYTATGFPLITPYLKIEQGYGHLDVIHYKRT